MAAARVDDYSLVPLRLIARFRDTDLAVGTCFFYQHASGLHLITNWHNVTGKNPNTLELLDEKNAGIPDRLHIDLHQKGQLGRWRSATLRLYGDDTFDRPNWLVHLTSPRERVQLQG
jgi:hypothetical protein